MHLPNRPTAWLAVALVALLPATARPDSLTDAADAYRRIAAAECPCPADLTAYNAALAAVLREARAAGQLDPRCKIVIGDRAVPTGYRCFVWRPDEFNEVRFREEVPVDANRARSRIRPGLGVPLVVLRRPKGDVSDHFFAPDGHPFAATAVLHFGATGPAVLAFYDPVRVEDVPVGVRRVPLAADPDAPFDEMARREDVIGYRLTGVLKPARLLPLTGIYGVEPYQPGKIPVVLVHGLGSSPTSWVDMVGDLRATPGFTDRFQVWLFAYPSGASMLRGAAELRASLRAAVVGFDPECRDPALRRMVLVGHSLGGILSKLQVSSSGDDLEEAVFRRSFEAMRGPTEAKEFFARQLYFEAQPFVTRVIYIGAPHCGASLPFTLGGWVAGRVIHEEPEALAAYRQLRRDNPFAVRIRFRELPNSIDLLEHDHPLLLAVRDLPYAPWVTRHEVAGIGRRLPALHHGDNVVPLKSSRERGVASSLLVTEGHQGLLRHPDTVAEVQRILAVHLDAP